MHRRSRRLAVSAIAAALALAALVSPSDRAAASPERSSVFAATHVVRGDLGTAGGTPRAWATRALRAEGPRIGLGRSDVAAVRWESVHRSPVGVVVRGRAYRDGVPVLGSDALVAAVDGRIAQVEARAVTLAGRPSAAPVRPAAARLAALTRLGVTHTLVPSAVRRVLVPRAGRLVDTFQVAVLSATRAARVDLDAATGRVLAVVDANDYDDASHRQRAGATVKARVYDPNPVVTARDSSLRAPGETGAGAGPALDSAELTAQLRTRTMRGLDQTRLAAGGLAGPWVDVVAPTGYLTLPTGAPLSYGRSDPRFVGLMAYLHIDRYQRWLRSLGLTQVNNEAQRTIPAPGSAFDNSFYQPGNDIIVFGGGGIPDAEDAEVILHEYGHAMQDAQVPGYGETDEGGAMGEGFGDFNAANYYALTSGGFGDLCAADWDATSYSTDDPPCLRRLDSTKRYPADVEGEVHADGEMWSAYLWRVRSHLGTTTKQRSVNAARLVIGMHEFLTPQAKFADAVAGLRLAAKALGRPGWAKFVDAEARRTGFGLDPS